MNIRISFKQSFKKGFSLTEVTIGLGLTLILGAFAYKALTSQVKSQFTESSVRSYNNQAAQALEKIRKDLQAMDFKWITMGTTPISWADAANGAARIVQNPDAVPIEPFTFAIPSESFKTILRLSANVGKNDLLTSSFSIVPIADSDDLKVGDWVIVVQSRQHVVAKIAEKVVSAGMITDLDIEFPNSEAIGLVAHGWWNPPAVNDWAANEAMIQKVHLITYDIATINEEGSSNKYLVRKVDGPRSASQQILAKAETLDVDFDYKGRGNDLDITDHEGFATAGSPTLHDLVAVRVALTGEVEGRAKEFATKVSLTGADFDGRYQAGGGEVVKTGVIGTAGLYGQPVLEHYGDGSKHIIVPVTTFASTATDTSGTAKSRLFITNAETGQTLSSATGFNALGTILHISTATSLGDPNEPSSSPGLVAGGYRETAAAVREPTIAFVPRDGSGRFSHPASTAVLRTLPNPGGLNDTNSIAVIDDHIFIAPYTKDDGASSLKVFRTAFDSGPKTFDTPVLEYENSASVTDKIVTGLGRGPTIGGKKTLVICESNSTAGTTNGELKIAPVNSDGSLDTATTIAYVDYDCKGISSDKAGNLIIGGRLTAHTLHAQTVADIVDGYSAPTVFNLDDKAYGVLYYEAYHVEGIEQTIKWLQGTSLISDDILQAQIAIANNTAFFCNGTTTPCSPSGGQDENNTSVTHVLNEGYRAKLMGSIQLASINPNESEVSLAYAAGRAKPPTAQLPPGQYEPLKFNGTDRMTPSPRCPRPLAGSSAPSWVWFSCFARSRGANPPNPGCGPACDLAFTDSN